MSAAEAEKRAAAEAAALLVEDGMTIGLGTGSTVAFLLPALAQRGLDGIRCVATSVATEEQARALGIPVEDFDRLERLDLAIDGTDEVTPDGWLIKGGGGAHLREKVVAAAAARFVVIGDSSKPVDSLRGPVPLELFGFGAASTLARLGPEVERRDVPPSPDGGVIADYRGPIGDPAALAARLEADPGVAAHGLFPPAMVSEVFGGERGLRQPSDPDLTTRRIRMSDFTELTISGRIATPSDPDWDQARLAWNLAVDQQPAAVAFVESAADVTAVVGFAAANGLRVAGQSSGHGASPLPPLDGTILLKTERMRGIAIDPEERTARVEAGVLSLELAEAAGEHGLASLPGSSPDVGVVGYTLGGGLSWLGRQYGFACNNVTGIDVVTAAGEQRSVTASDDPDLFWALRGGGGGYAIVTALHLALLPIAEVYGGILIFPAEAAPAPSAPIATGPRPRPRRSPRSPACCDRRRSPTCRSRCAAKR